MTDTTNNPPYGSRNETPIRPETEQSQAHVQVSREHLQAAAQNLGKR